MSGWWKKVQAELSHQEHTPQRPKGNIAMKLTSINMTIVTKLMNMTTVMKIMITTTITVTMHMNTHTTIVMALVWITATIMAPAE